MKRRLTLLAAMALTVLAAGAAQAALIDGLQGYWDFNDFADPGQALDTSGNANHGTIQAGAVYTADGGGFTGTAGDRAMDFTPTGNSRVSLPGNTWGSITTNNEATISLWIYGAAAQPQNDTAFSWYDGGTRKLQTHIPWGNQNIYWDVGGCCGGNVRINKAEPDPSKYRGQWNHYVFIKEGTTGQSSRIYQNGVLWHWGTTSGSIGTITSAVIGAENTSGGNNYNGLIDDFAIWDRPLTDTEIMDLWNGVPILSPPAAGTHTWDGLGNGNWNVGARWVGTPKPPPYPDHTIIAEISAPNIVSTTQDEAAHTLNISNNGTVAIGAGRTLDIVAAVDATGGTIQFGDGARLRGGEFAVGDIRDVVANGNAEFDIGRSFTVEAYNQAAPGSLTKSGEGTLSLESIATAPGELILAGGTVAVAGNPYTAADIPPAGLQLHLDASSLGLADGAAVTNWPDQSGFGRDFNGVIGDPSYVASGTHGQPAVNFDGNDALRMNSGDNPRSFIDGNGEYTLISVARYSGGDRERVIAARTGHNWLFGYHGNSTKRWYGDGWISLDVGGGSTDTNWHLHMGLMNVFGDASNPAADFYLDGVLLTNDGRGSGDGFNNYVPDGLSLGGWNGLGEASTAEVSELIMFDRILSTAELNTVGSYLSSKYSIAGTGYAGAPVNMTGTSIRVEASSTLHADASAADFGALTLNDGVLGTSGAPDGMSFTSTTIGPAATVVGFDTGTDTTPGAITNNSPNVTIVKAGDADLLLPSTGSTGLVSTTTFDVQGGRLPLLGDPIADTLPQIGDAAINFSGGQVVIASPSGDGLAVSNAVTASGGYSVLTAGMGGIPGAIPGQNVILTGTPNISGGTLRLETTDNYTLSIPALDLSGGTIEVEGEFNSTPHLVTNVLRERYFDNLNGDLYIAPIDSGVGYLTRSDFTYDGALDVNLNFNGPRFDSLGGTGTDGIGAVWFGRMNIGGDSPLQPGTITLATGSDDGSTFYVDLNHDGVFDTSTEMIVNNRGYHGGIWRYGVIPSIAEGKYDIALGFFEGGGGEWIEARFAQGDTFGNAGAMTTINPGSPAQAGLWEAEVAGPGPIDMSTVNVNVTADSGINAITNWGATFGHLTMEAGVLTTSGARDQGISFIDTTIDPAATLVGFEANSRIVPGAINANGANVSIVVDGTNAVILDQPGAGLNNTTFDIQGGSLVSVGRMPIGFHASTGAALHLTGGELVLASHNGLDVSHDRVPVVTADSTLTAGTGGAGVPGPLTVTLLNGLQLDSGVLSLRATDDYTLEIGGGPVTGSGIDIAEGTIVIPGLIDVGTLRFTGGELVHPGTSIAPDTFEVFGSTVNLPGTTIIANEHHFIDATVNADLAGGTVDVDAGNTHTTLLGNNTYTGVTRIHQGALEVLPGASNLGPGNLQLHANSGAWDIETVLMTSGLFTRPIGTGDGQVQWVDDGGFAARGGPLTVDLGGDGTGTGPTVVVGNAATADGMNNQWLHLGHRDADNQVTFMNDIDLGTGNRHIHVYENPNLPGEQTVNIISGHVTSSNPNEWLDVRGTGVLWLQDPTNDYVSRTNLYDGVTLRVGLDGAGLGPGYMRFTGPDNIATVLEAHGTFTRPIDNTFAAGTIYWEADGGFAAWGGPLDVTLDGGATLQWGSATDGFRGMHLHLGSRTANDVVTMTNDIDHQNGDWWIEVFDNPDSPNDRAVMSGLQTNVRNVRVRSGGDLTFSAAPFTASGTFHLYGDGTTVHMPGDMNAWNLWTEWWDATSLNVTGNVKLQENTNLQGGDHWIGGNLEIGPHPDSRWRELQLRGNAHLTVDGDATLWRMWTERDHPTGLTVHGNLVGDENFDIQGGVHTIDGDFTIFNPATPQNNDRPRELQLRGSADFNVGGTATVWRIWTEYDSPTRFDITGNVESSEWVELNGGTHHIGGDLNITHHMDGRPRDLGLRQDASLTVDGNAHLWRMWTDWWDPTQLTISGDVRAYENFDFNGGVTHIGGNLEILHTDGRRRDIHQRGDSVFSVGGQVQAWRIWTEWGHDTRSHYMGDVLLDEWTEFNGGTHVFDGNLLVGTPRDGVPRDIRVRSNNAAVPSTLVLNGPANAASNLFVENFGRFSGNGQINVTGSVEIWNGATLAPGTGIGTLTSEVGNRFLMAGGSSYEWELGPGGDTDDLAVVLGNLQVDAITTLRMLDGGVSDHNYPPIFPDEQFDIFTYTGTTNLPAGDVGSIIALDTSGIDPGLFFVWDVSGLGVYHDPLDQRVYLTGLAAVMIPEPGTAAILGLSLLALARRRRRRK
jgi:autotransporter-associated beta strand protein